jgi:hypothetical protein
MAEHVFKINLVLPNSLVTVFFDIFDRHIIGYNFYGKNTNTKLFLNKDFIKFSTIQSSKTVPAVNYEQSKSGKNFFSPVFIFVMLRPVFCADASKKIKQIFLPFLRNLQSIDFNEWSKSA